MIDVALLCLALNVYFEARSEPFEGQVAVAEVTLTRAQGWSHLICQEVFRPGQFTWTEEPYRFVQEGTAWKVAQEAAYTAYVGNTNYSLGATHFHADYVSPKWAQKLCVITKIGRHIFYKECK